MLTQSLAIALLLTCAAERSGGAPPAAAEPHPRKPADCFDASLLYVKFTDDLTVRLGADGRSLTDRGTGDLAAAEPALASLKGSWSRVHELPDERLEELRTNATKNLGRAAPDLRTEFFLRIENGESRKGTQELLASLACVQRVGVVPLPAPPPVAPDFTPAQGYLFDAAIGHGSSTCWAWPGGRGQNVRVCDLEYGWNLAHVDLPAVTRIGPAGEDPFSNPNHGTAVLGIMLARNDGAGTTGMCHAATGHVVPTVRNGVWNVATAITTALTVLQPGDILVLEQQTFGPNHPGGSSQLGLVPCDWVLAWYNAIVTATGNGVTVIEAAGNGSQNLDDPVYSTGNGGHWPFLPANDSGAVLVGGGLTPAYGVDDRTRLVSSNYGSTVDLQSFAAFVTTLGFGQLYSAEGANVYYTGSFSGTSSASAIVAGAGAQLQSMMIALRGTPLTPQELRDVLRATALPQQGTPTIPASQNVGPRPNLVGAAFQALSAPDCNDNGVPDEIDIALAPALDSDLSGTIDFCERPCDTRLSVLSNAPDLIPDGSAGASSTLLVPAASGPLAGLTVWVDLWHLHAGDVTITLRNGVIEVPLVARVGRTGLGDGDSSDLQGRYVFTQSAPGDLWSAAAAAGPSSPIPLGPYRPTGESTGGAPAPSSFAPFIGQVPAGEWTLTITDSRTGDRGTRVRWGLVLGTRSAECCVGDFDGSGGTSIVDIFAFLSAWFGASQAADINLDGLVTVPDIFAFLVYWFAGCP